MIWKDDQAWEWFPRHPGATTVGNYMFPHQTHASLPPKHIWEDDQAWETLFQTSPPLGYPPWVDTLAIFGQYILIELPKHYFVG